MDNEKFDQVTKRIIVSGIVQGVGFRPLAYRLAKKYGINGTVRNIGGMVEILTQSSKQEFHDFLHELQISKCEGCEIIHIEIQDLNIAETDSKKETDSTKKTVKTKNTTVYTDFRIIESTTADAISIIPPDLTVCRNCSREFYTKSDRRFENPFISCMSCGPRYTIIEKLPYDRDNTTMVDFAMCPSCREEYQSPLSRRFHAQTISCNDCGPYLIFEIFNSTECSNTEYSNTECSNTECSNTECNNTRRGNQAAFERAASIIKNGGIIAVKGIGGYHFVCSPFVEKTVQNLRKLKGREEKPFAVMFPSVQSVMEYCEVSEEEKALLESNARPIVLLYSDNQKMAPATCKNSTYCGAFLPYTPLQIMLLDECGPLIMTSANISGQPIIRNDQKIAEIESPLLQGALYNPRRILRSVDDSVAKVIDHKVQIIRRSRGYVPYPIFLSQSMQNHQILAMGGDLKAAYCLYKNGQAVVSQYFGDLEERTILDEYIESIEDMSTLLKIVPDKVICDWHPNYFSARYAKTLGLPIEYVQHHHAHVASVMAEHDLKGKVIGVAFDGTGYGTDGNIWGSEFLICEGADFERVAHLQYTPLLGGDQSMRDAKKTADCFLINAGLKSYINDERSDIIEAALKNNINTVLSSSMGRLFDAVASILKIRDENSYEGECASDLEKEALLAEKNHIIPKKMSFVIKHQAGLIEIDPKSVLGTLGSLQDDSEKGAFALGFHYAVADMVLEVCEILRIEQNCNTVAICGGVFQNTILVRHTLKLLRECGFLVYYNMAVPPNDGSISLGQTYIGLKR